MSRFLLAALSGVLAALSFLSDAVAPLILVALVPLLIAVFSVPRHQSAPFTALRLGWITGLVAHSMAFAWVWPTVMRFEHTSALFALPFFALFVGYYALQFALFAAGVAWRQGAGARGRGSGWEALPTADCFFVAAWWTLLEWGFPKIVPFCFGDALAGSPLLRQAVDLGGAYGLSFLIVFVGACLASGIVRREATWMRRMQPVAIAAAVLAVWTMYGSVRACQFGKFLWCPFSAAFSREVRTDQTAAADARPLISALRSSDNSLNVAIVQGGLRSGREDLEAANEEAWATYARLTEQIGRDVMTQPVVSVGSEADTRNSEVRIPDSDPDLIVWPETVLRVYLLSDQRYRARLLALVRQAQRPLLVGSLDLPGDNRGEFNSAYLFATDAGANGKNGIDARSAIGHLPSAIQIYHKQWLLPFGEYVPHVAWLPLLQRWQTTGRFVPGEPAHPFMLVSDQHQSPAPVTISFATSICFEVVWPGAFNRLVRDGAAFLVNLTDDGWFGDSAAPYEHLRAATLRAVETRRWLVRASNSGVSAFVDPTGRTVAALPLHAVGVVDQRVEPLGGQSLYVRFGDWPVASCFVFVVVFVLWTRAERPSPLRQRAATGYGSLDL